jgi:hypothetical protein
VFVEENSDLFYLVRGYISMKMMGDRLCNDLTSVPLQKILHGCKIVAVIYENIIIRFECPSGLMSAEGNGS